MMASVSSVGTPIDPTGSTTLNPPPSVEEIVQNTLKMVNKHENLFHEPPAISLTSSSATTGKPFQNSDFQLLISKAIAESQSQLPLINEKIEAASPVSSIWRMTPKLLQEPITDTASCARAAILFTHMLAHAPFYAHLGGESQAPPIIRWIILNADEATRELIGKIRTTIKILIADNTQFELAMKTAFFASPTYLPKLGHYCLLLQDVRSRTLMQAGTSAAGLQVFRETISFFNPVETLVDILGKQLPTLASALRADMTADGKLQLLSHTTPTGLSTPKVWPFKNPVHTSNFTEAYDKLCKESAASRLAGSSATSNAESQQSDPFITARSNHQGGKGGGKTNFVDLAAIAEGQDLEHHDRHMSERAVPQHMFQSAGFMRGGYTPRGAAQSINASYYAPGLDLSNDNIHHPQGRNILQAIGAGTTGSSKYLEVGAFHLYVAPYQETDEIPVTEWPVVKMLAGVLNPRLFRCLRRLVFDIIIFRITKSGPPPTHLDHDWFSGLASQALLSTAATRLDEDQEYFEEFIFDITICIMSSLLTKRRWERAAEADKGTKLEVKEVVWPNEFTEKSRAITLFQSITNAAKADKGADYLIFEYKSPSELLALFSAIEKVRVVVETCRSAFGHDPQDADITTAPALVSEFYLVDIITGIIFRIAKLWTEDPVSKIQNCQLLRSKLKSHNVASHYLQKSSPHAALFLVDFAMNIKGSPINETTPNSIFQQLVQHPQFIKNQTKGFNHKGKPINYDKNGKSKNKQGKDQGYFKGKGPTSFINLGSTSFKRQNDESSYSSSPEKTPKNYSQQPPAQKSSFVMMLEEARGKILESQLLYEDVTHDVLKKTPKLCLPHLAERLDLKNDKGDCIFCKWGNDCRRDPQHSTTNEYAKTKKKL
ncbi:unnamed protein product [Amoebophrya sp. A25]|nr:unnamed protein product [Amoebophrya sp. A25]|eukprot:GSA25T00003671001.1